jgi:hypothetical protein
MWITGLLAFDNEEDAKTYQETYNCRIQTNKDFAIRQYIVSLNPFKYIYKDGLTTEEYKKKINQEKMEREENKTLSKEILNDLKTEETELNDFVNNFSYNKRNELLDKIGDKNIFVVLTTTDNIDDDIKDCFIYYMEVE